MRADEGREWRNEAREGFGNDGDGLLQSLDAQVARCRHRRCGGREERQTVFPVLVMASPSGQPLASFGLRLFAELCAAEPSANVVLSPLVVADALSLAVAGATPGSATQV